MTPVRCYIPKWPKYGLWCVCFLPSTQRFNLKYSLEWFDYIRVAQAGIEQTKRTPAMGDTISIKQEEGCYFCRVATRKYDLHLLLHAFSESAVVFTLHIIFIYYFYILFLHIIFTYYFYILFLHIIFTYYFYILFLHIILTYYFYILFLHIIFTYYFYILFLYIIFTYYFYIIILFLHIIFTYYFYILFLYIIFTYYFYILFLHIIFTYYFYILFIVFTYFMQFPSACEHSVG